MIPALEIACRCYPRSVFSSHPLHTVSLCYCFIVSLCYTVWPLTAARTPVSAVMQHWRVMQRGANTPLTALTFCQHFDSLFEGLEGKSAGACIRLHIEGSLKAAFSLTERRGGGRYCSRWNNGSCGATCSGAHMNGRALGMCVGQWPGVSVPKPLSQRLTMNPHKVGAPRGHRPPPLLSRTSKHINIY